MLIKNRGFCSTAQVLQGFNRVVGYAIEGDYFRSIISNFGEGLVHVPLGYAGIIIFAPLL